MEVKLRPEAVALGHTRYWTGKPCKNGHTAYRYTLSSACSECVRAAARKSQGAVRSFQIAQSQARRQSREVVKVEVHQDDVASLNGFATCILNEGRSQGFPFPAGMLTTIRDALAGGPLPSITGLHPDDVPAATEFIDALKAARALMAPVLPRQAPSPFVMPAVPAAAAIAQELEVEYSEPTPTDIESFERDAESASDRAYHAGEDSDAARLAWVQQHGPRRLGTDRYAEWYAANRDWLEQ